MSIDNTSAMQERTMTLEECQAALTAARQETEELRDKYLRAAAALDNTRKQAERDAAQRASQRLRSFFIRLLEVADNLERALAHASQDNPLRPGVQVTLDQLRAMLRQEGVVLIAADAGTSFDPQVHEAISTQEANVDQATVAEILQSGYLFDGKVLRPARVIVTIPARTGA